ncbi:MAG: hypothetical protein CMP10_19435, partial [Zetaproteobacteria bacterium]|nr:hypothetical protein [Pseudobdellovibrionaceae bacterium]
MTLKLKNLKKYRFYLVLTLLPFTPATASYGSDQIGIIGDDLTTGAAAWSTAAYDADALLAIFTGKEKMQPTDEQKSLINELGFARASDLAPPVRLSASPREFVGGGDWILKTLMHGVQHRFLDYETFSWSYLLSRQMGYQGSQILIAAQDGARSNSAIVQLDRILQRTDGALPNDIIVQFTSGDVCGRFSHLVTTEEDYADNIRRFLRYAEKNGAPGSSGTNVWLFDPVGMMQIAINKDILSKQVKAHGN